MSEQARSPIPVHGPFVLLGSTWVRHDTVATINGKNGGEGPWCQVVLTVPGYKTLSTDHTSEELFYALALAASHGEHESGLHRAMGMREAGLR
jgi:hypothetical protein